VIISLEHSSNSIKRSRDIPFEVLFVARKNLVGPSHNKDLGESKLLSSLIHVRARVIHQHCLQRPLGWVGVRPASAYSEPAIQSLVSKYFNHSLNNAHHFEVNFELIL
jgi:hypothetical protein